MDPEPTVLDYVKARLTPWRGKAPRIPDLPGEEPPQSGEARAGFAWRVWLAPLLALLAQILLDRPSPAVIPAVALYTAAAGCLVWAMLRGEWRSGDAAPQSDRPLSMTYHWRPLAVGLGAMLLAFIALGGNRFNPLNVALWLVAVISVALAFWETGGGPSVLEKARAWLRDPQIRVRISRWGLLMTGAVLAALFFRLYQLNSVPGEMFSDHAEKLLDVADVLNGQTSIFFVRNTGREAIQFYWTALIANVLGTGLSFMSLKIGTVLIGLFALPFVYLLGKEISGSRWVGLIALLLAGTAYWLNTTARVGLRFPLYPALAAPTLYFLVRGLRRSDRNALILSGIFLGIGLHGYSTSRIMPLLALAAVLIYTLHGVSRGNRPPAWAGLVLLGFMAFLVFLPLARYAIENPAIFNYRALTRLSSMERVIEQPPLLVFASNVWKAWIMPFFNNGYVWVHSVPGRPALTIVDAALYFLGTVTVLARYIRKRNWMDLFLLVSVPLLMLPSSLAIAFPEENPALNRTGAAAIMVFILAAIGLQTLFESLRARMDSRSGVWAAGLVTAALLLGSAAQNYDIVFRQYATNFLNNAWNTSDIGRVVHGFATSVGTPDTAYVIPSPHWVDTRLVGMQAGYPLRDYALDRSLLESTLTDARPKLFIFKPEDEETRARLAGLYPTGELELFDSPLEGKDFYMYTVLSR